jgi:hypothetical protein
VEKFPKETNSNNKVTQKEEQFILVPKEVLKNFINRIELHLPTLQK